ncbi:tyrosine-type recombinase/integrase [Streptomyces gardneri]|uniref:Site-specific integrase n=1 Tax=Streptomyces gardneri TaxID=66892 RepID=A0A4Y3RQ58_9ACTN|nr:site-specific integrase [Streptomyces gardneri]GEB58927.1 site-specific integrase [Streptomyces gardneri]GHG83523.1 site-specific integrase [Streptomyces gardneri]
MAAPRKPKRNPNGSGTVTKRTDGRYQAAVYVLQPDGTRARKFVYGKTWAACDAKRRALLEKVDNGIPVPTRSMKLAEWLPYWLDNIVKPRRKRTTAAKYEVHVRLYLVPMIGSKRLESLSVADVRRFLVELERKSSAATAKESHRVLRTALTAACREELVPRNVATLVEPPTVADRDLDPWSLDETLDFLAAARKDPLYAAFVLAIALGFRRGEIVGLRWENVDLDRREIRVRTQRQRVGGEVYEDDPKGRRRKQTLPLPGICVAPLRWQRLKQAAARELARENWEETGYVFTTRTGRPIEPRNLYRSFTRVAKNAGLRVIRLHDARHGTATLLTAAGVPPRVVMEILGHSQIAVTMNVYAHVVQDTQRDAISHMDRLLRRRPRS